MARFLIVIALLTLQIYALVDLVRADSDQVRVVPKSLWFVVWLIPVLGPIAWLLLGRPQVGPSSGGGGGPGGGGGLPGGPRPTRGPVAPDDDPEFLRRLDEQSWAARMERLRREREAGGRPADPGPGARPEQDPEARGRVEGGSAPGTPTTSPDAPADGAGAS